MTRDYNKPAKTPDTAALKDTISQLTAGDTVRAVFYDQHYRTFELTGVIQPSSYDPNQFLLASWQVNIPTSDSLGKAASALKELEIVETASRTLF